MAKDDHFSAAEARRKRDGLTFASTATPEGEAAVARQGLIDWEREKSRDCLPALDPLADLLEELGGGDRAAAVLRQFMLFCLPPKNYGDARRFKSGFYRMVAFAWRLAPELLDGCQTDKHVADRLGISPTAFFKHLENVDRVLSHGGASSQNRDRKGSSRDPLAGRGSD